MEHPICIVCKERGRTLKGPFGFKHRNVGWQAQETTLEGHLHIELNDDDFEWTLPFELRLVSIYKYVAMLQMTKLEREGHDKLLKSVW